MQDGNEPVIVLYPMSTLISDTALHKAVEIDPLRELSFTCSDTNDGVARHSGMADVNPFCQSSRELRFVLHKLAGMDPVKLLLLRSIDSSAAFRLPSDSFKKARKRERSGVKRSDSRTICDWNVFKPGICPVKWF